MLIDELSVSVSFSNMEIILTETAHSLEYVSM